jgi:hypothetical protein
LLVVLGASVLGPSCKCGRDKPYVPYSIESTPDGAISVGGDAAAPTAAVVDDAGPQALALVRAPQGARSVVVDGFTLAAPTGQTFLAASVFDWDGDGSRDAAAVLKADSSTAIATFYSVALYRGAGSGLAPASVIASSPPIATCPPPSGAPSEVPVKLTRRGRSSLVVEVGATCANRMSSRWLLIGATEGKSPRARFSVGIADPPGAHPLIVEAEPADRDGDGIDDVILRASLEGAAPPFEPGPRVTASLVWLDRSAGLSRDPEEPEASFRAITGPLGARAARAKDAALVPVSVRQLRHLAHALCAEGGAARLVQLAGASLPACAGSRALEEAGLAEARAHASGGDALRAALAFDRAQRPPAAKTPARIKELQGAIEKLAPPSDAGTTRVCAAVPDEPAREIPSFGPLAFEPDGHALIRTRAGVVRADPVHGDEVDAGRPPWPSPIGGEGHPTFAMALSACDGVAIRAVFTKSEGGGGELLLPIVPALGERCVVPRGEPAIVRPLAWGPSGLEAIIAGEPILVSGEAVRASLLAAPLDAPGALGSAKSPDGHFVVVPTGLGLVVRGPGGSRILRAHDFEPYGDLRFCAVSNDGKRVACTKNKRVVVGMWD